jgi:Trp operon repressor
VAIYEPVLDRFAEDRIITWLANPDVAGELSSRDNSPAAKAAREDRKKAERQIEEYRKLAERGDIDAVDFARAKKGAQARIADALRREKESAMPAVVGRFLGEQARAGWAAADNTIRRQLVQAVAEIRVHRVGRDAGAAGPVDPVYRVGWRWLLLGAGEWIPPLSWEEAKAERAAARAQLHRRRDYAYASKERTDMITQLLRAEPGLADREIARRIGSAEGARVATGRIRRELESAGEIPVIRRSGRAQFNAGLGPVPELPSGIAKDKREKIRGALMQPGGSHRSVARMFGVSITTVGRVCAETGPGCRHGRRAVT